MPCREGPGHPEWLALTNGERAAVFFISAAMADDSLDRRLYMGTALDYMRGVYGRRPTGAPWGSRGGPRGSSGVTSSGREVHTTRVPRGVICERCGRTGQVTGASGLWVDCPDFNGTGYAP